MKKIIFIMGVSASGKSTLGHALARATGQPFFDGDDFHPPENIAKMSAGAPLNDQDRRGWLSGLNQMALDHRQNGAIIGCSALKETYREWLMEGLDRDQVLWVVLVGDYEQILDRSRKRTDHFMPASLLESQFQTLEVPPYGMHLSCIELNIPQMVQAILRELGT